MLKQLKNFLDRGDAGTALPEREQIILEHLPQIKYIAHRIHARVPKGVELDDLIGAGIVGLMDAIAKFEPEKGVKFKTYAEVRIRGAILDSLRALDWAPRKLRQKSRELEAVMHRLAQREQRPATDQEIADELKISLVEFYELLNELKSVNLGGFHTMASSADYDAEESEVRYFPFAPVPSPYHVFQKEEVIERLSEAIQNLPVREQEVLSLYYLEELTMKEIGEVMGITESRVCQIHSRAVLRLRGMLMEAASPL